jgi:signal transduction histidine kinase/ligand-binding sensor domain-containing protein
MRIIFLCAAVVIFQLTATAAPTDSSWYARTWETEDGLPNNNVNSLAQTPDGFIWVATPLGLTRFDGVTFDEICLTNFVARGNRGATALLQNGSDGLRVEMDRGAIANLNARNITVLNPTNGLLDSAAQTMVECDDGALWISYTGGSVCYLKNGKATVVSHQLGLPWASISSIAKDTKNRIWIARNGQIGIFRDGRFQSLAATGDHCIRLAAARAGGVWICSGTHLFHFDEGLPLRQVANLPAGNACIESSIIFEDRQGAVWVGTAYNGLFRFDGNDFEKIPTSHPEISSLLEDSEGNIWVGTHGGGLNRLRRRAITLEDSQNGLPFEAVQSMCEDACGTLWAVTENGLLARRNTNAWETISTNAGWPGGAATCVAADHNGSIWIGTHNYQLVHAHDGRFDVLNQSQGLQVSPISALFIASNDDLWIGGVNHTLQFLHAGRFTTIPLRENVHSIRAIAQDTAGDIWIGTSRGVLMRVQGTNIVNQTQSAAGPTQSIRCLYAATDGSLWLGYAGSGLGRIKSGHFSQLSTERGLFDDYISQIIPDGHGWFWFGADRGIFKVREQELITASEYPNVHVRSIHYGRGEGLPGLQANFEFAPGATRTHDGRIWIPTQSALVVVNPQSCNEHSKPPPVFLKSMVVDGNILAAYSGPLPLQGVLDIQKPATLQLPPDHREIKFHFTALNFSAPENVRLQYRLDGLDKGWMDAPPDRQAIFSRLPAGNYSFHVRAGSSDGLWSDSNAAFAFTVTPFLWQRWWFQSLILLVFGSMMIVTVRYISFRRLRSRLHALEQQAALDKERARIARDLHDDLGSHLTKIVLLSDLMYDYRRDPNKSSETAQSVSSTARQVIKTLDETVWAVNPRNDTLPHLVDYVGQFAVEFLRMAGIRCRVDLPLRVPDEHVSTEVRHNLFLVVKEALNNVVNHARATEVSLHITVDDRTVRLFIEDNGRGFDHAPANGCADGLRNMRQRIEEIGGAFELQSKPAAGTRISVTAPLNK